MDLTEEYINVRTQRAALEKQANDIKNGREAELKAAILTELSAQGMKSAHLKGVGRISQRVSKHYEIQDIDQLAYAMFKNMIAAGKEGRPLADALILQRRISRDSLESYLDNYSAAPELGLQTFGVKQVETYDLSFTKEKEKA